MQKPAWCKLLEMCAEVLSCTGQVFDAVFCARALCKLEAEAVEASQNFSVSICEMEVKMFHRGSFKACLVFRKHSEILDGSCCRRHLTVVPKFL